MSTVRIDNYKDQKRYAIEIDIEPLTNEELEVIDLLVKKIKPVLGDMGQIGLLVGTDNEFLKDNSKYVKYKKKNTILLIEALIYLCNPINKLKTQNELS
jgi:hypothetical protein